MMQKHIFVVTITRGRKTRFFYGERLKDALDVANPKRGETFTYAKFARSAVQRAQWFDGTYITNAA